MKQIGLAILNYESAKKELPLAYTPNYTGTQLGGLCNTTGVSFRNASNKQAEQFVLTLILPYIEQQTIYDRIDLSKHWHDTTNNGKGTTNRAATSVDIADFLCPTAENRPGKFTTDYFTLVDISDTDYCQDVEGGPMLTKQRRSREKLAGMLQDVPMPVRKVSDGLSKTFMFFESAGRPNLYDRNRSLAGEMQPINRGSTPDLPHRDTQWADDRVYALWGNVFDPTKCPITSIMNCDNYSEIYSFHSGGANFLYGDGSVDLLSEDTNIDAFISMFTAAADDVIAERR